MPGPKGRTCQNQSSIPHTTTAPPGAGLPQPPDRKPGSRSSAPAWPRTNDPLWNRHDNPGPDEASHQQRGACKRVNPGDDPSTGENDENSTSVNIGSQRPEDSRPEQESAGSTRRQRTADTQ